MTQAQFEVRKDKSENGALIASRTEEGFRVYSVSNPSKVYLVRQEGEQWICTCPDFDVHKADSTWLCDHILAVMPNGEHVQAQAPQSNNGTGKSGVPAEPPVQPPAHKQRTRKDHNGSAQMLIKRSVSPDGRIDSVSVEFSMAVSDISNGGTSAAVAG